MFIKIADSPEAYANTDHIETVTFGRTRTSNKGCMLVFYSGRSYPITEQAGRLLLEFAETNTAYDGELPDEASSLLDPTATTSLDTARQFVGSNLKSRIAQLLRDGAPNGMALMDIAFATESDNDPLADALRDLINERVVVAEGEPPRYYHATNAPGRIAPSEF
jgi:hypothetical protein